MKIKKQLICMVAAFLVVIAGCSTNKDNNTNSEVVPDTGFENENTDIKENKQEFTVNKDIITIHFELYDLDLEKQEDGTTKLSVDGFSASYDENSLPFILCVGITTRYSTERCQCLYVVRNDSYAG